MSNKVLITSGCSFTAGWKKHLTWADYLSKDYDLFFNEGRGAQSNRLIKNRVYYRVNQCLKDNINPKDITVGIMLTGLDRTAIYNHFEDKVETNRSENFRLLRNFNFAPSTYFVWKPLVQINAGVPFDSNYYKHAYLESDHIARLLEDIIAIQNFLENKGIKYFMTTAWDLSRFRNDTWSHGYKYRTPTDIFTSTPLKELGLQADLDYLIKSINFDKFINIMGMWEYCYFINPKRDCEIHHHPTGEESKRFSDEIIKPFIQKL